MAPGFWQIALVILLIVLLFGGRGKISSIMGDFAKGIRSFRKGLSEEDEKPAENADADQKQAFVTKGGEDAVDVTPEQEKAATGAASAETAKN